MSRARPSTAVSLGTACAVVSAVAVSAAAVFAPGLFAVLASGMVFGAALVALVVVTTGDAADRSRVMLWTLLSFALHVALAFGMWWTRISDSIAPDARAYHEGARQLYDHWSRDLPFHALAAGKEGFYYSVAALYRVWGAFPEVPLLWNAAMAAATLPVLAQATRRLFNPGAARWIPPLLVLIPSFLFWPSLLLREAPIYFLIAVSINCAVRLLDKISLTTLVVLVLALAALLTFRASVGIVLAPGLAIGIMLSRRQVLTSVTLGLAAGAAMMALVLGVGLGQRGYQISLSSDLEDVSELRSDLSQQAASGVAPDAEVGTARQAVAYLPIGLTAFMLGPFPWQLNASRQLVILPDMLVWWALIPAAWVGIVAAVRSGGRRVLILLVPAGLVAAALSLLIGNYGMIVRERPQVVIMLLPFIALGCQELRTRLTGSQARTPVAAR